MTKKLHPAIAKYLETVTYELQTAATPAKIRQHIANKMLDLATEMAYLASLSALVATDADADADAE